MVRGDSDEVKWSLGVPSRGSPKYSTSAKQQKAGYMANKQSMTGGQALSQGLKIHRTGEILMSLVEN